VAKLKQHAAWNRVQPMRAAARKNTAKLIFQEEFILGPEWEGLLLTGREFDAVEEYDENYHYELVNGVVIVSPLPLREETGPNELLGRLLGNYQEDHPQGKSLDLTLPQQYVRTKRNSRRIADRLIWAGLGRMPEPDELPTISVESVSGSKRDRRRDYVDKRKEYMAVKIPEYWIFDRFKRTLTVIHNGPDGTTELVVGENETYESALLPGFQVPVGRLLAAADSLAAARRVARKTKQTRRKK
jgi:Uma2 family endonuclease